MENNISKCRALDDNSIEVWERDFFIIIIASKKYIFAERLHL
jgi:hypothetical protein